MAEYEAVMRRAEHLNASTLSVADVEALLDAVAALTQHTGEPGASTSDNITEESHQAGVEFIDENGGGPGLRLRKRHETPTAKASFRSRGPASRIPKRIKPQIANRMGIDSPAVEFK
jgi:hypothetical protein